MSKQPEALRLARRFEKFGWFPDEVAAAVELRRLHEENKQLRKALKKYEQRYWGQPQ